jgi:hypothetical protein
MVSSSLLPLSLRSLDLSLSYDFVPSLLVLLGILELIVVGGRHLLLWGLLGALRVILTVLLETLKAAKTNVTFNIDYTS